MRFEFPARFQSRAGCRRIKGHGVALPGTGRYRGDGCRVCCGARCGEEVTAEYSLLHAETFQPRRISKVPVEV